jgi:hypothetical protein
MASSRIRLDPQTVEAIARRVVELLQRQGHEEHELVDAAELARRLGVDRSWVYTHAIELGAVKLGGGPRPRLRFDPKDAIERIRERALGRDTQAPATRRRRSPQASAFEDPRLLPIKPSGES